MHAPLISFSRFQLPLAATARSQCLMVSVNPIVARDRAVFS